MRGAAARLVGIGLVALLGLCAGAPAGAAARPPLEVLDSAGNPDVLAGSHPDRMITNLPSPETEGVKEATRDLIIDFPPGMGGDPTSVPVCAREAFDLNGVFEAPPCPAESQVGALVIVREGEVTERFPVYALEPAPGEVAAFGFGIATLRLKFSGSLRTTDFGLSMRLEGLPQEQPLEVGATIESYFEFWGVPADHQTETSIPRRPFLTLPTQCGTPLEVGIRERTWQRSGEWRSSVASTGMPLTGCQNLPFAPAVKLQLESPTTDTPTGLNLDLTFPQNDDPDGQASAQVKDTRLELPAGVGISLGAAARITACTDAQLNLNGEAPASCPASSKVGTTEFEVPQLSEPLVGNVYLGEEHPGDRFRVFVVIQSGEIEGKFVGTMSPNPATGRLTTTLSDMPPVALSRLRMHFDGGPRALLVTPSQCGAATVIATVTPNSGTPAVTTSDSTPVGARPGRQCGAPAPFEPSLAVATSNPRGGQPTSFSAVIGRHDGEQSAQRFSFQFPSGMSAQLGSVTPCSDADVQAVSCPAASRIGGAFIDLGTGPETAELAGNAYLTGPYRKGPFGFVLIFHLDVGPFHLGTLAVRAALELNPLTGQVTSQSDPLPQTFEGIPIQFQRLGLEIDRPGFLSNPTSCTPKRVGATIESTEGALAHPASEFFLRNCVALPFRPSFAVALTGASQLGRHGHPGLEVSMHSHKGDANIRSTELVMPAGLKFSSESLREICPRAEALKGACPKRSQVGTGFGRTPLLGKPLKGAVYVVQPQGDGEPDLWANLKGQGVELNIRSQSSTKKGRADSQFDELPDMPLSLFSMRFAGGKHGFLTLDRSFCVHGRPRSLTAPASFEAQNGATRQMRIAIATPKLCKTG
jgi:hypothetical protein